MSEVQINEAEPETTVVFAEWVATISHLHDRVIQRVFAAGLLLRSPNQPQAHGGDSDSKTEAAITQLDALLVDIRAAQFALYGHLPLLGRAIG